MGRTGGVSSLAVGSCSTAPSLTVHPKKWERTAAYRRFVPALRTDPSGFGKLVQVCTRVGGLRRSEDRQDPLLQLEIVRLQPLSHGVKVTEVGFPDQLLESATTLGAAFT